MARMPSRRFQSAPPIHQQRLAARYQQAGAPFSEILARPVVAVEIGCGVGWHSIQFASQNPKVGLVAIERTAAKFERFQHRIHAHNTLENICGINADATHFIDQNFPASTIDEVFLLYPNPEPKAVNRRWFRSPFLSRLAESMRPGARLHLATNIASYAHEAEEYAGFAGLTVASHREVSNVIDPGFKPRTHFEKKYFDRGETLCLLEFRKARL